MDKAKPKKVSYDDKYARGPLVNHNSIVPSFCLDAVLHNYCPISLSDRNVAPIPTLFT